MIRFLQFFSIALALLAMPGCCSEVFVPEPDGPTTGIFIVNQNAPNDFNVGASFRKVLSGTGGKVPSGTGRPGEIERDGACVLWHYDLPADLPASSLYQVLDVDAGELRVTGGLTDLTIDFESDYSLQGKGAIFEAGDVLTLHVEGSDEVPAMSVTLAAPPSPVLAPPPATIDIGEDLGFTWTSLPGTGTLRIQIQTYWDAVKTDYSSAVWNPRDIVACNVDISQGTLTMPASLLSQISTSAPRPASISADVVNVDSRQAGDSDVGFIVRAFAATPSDEAYRFDVDLK